MAEPEATSKTRPLGAPGAGFPRFLKFVLDRFLVDQCPQRAAALTYTTLLALVPLLAISFAVFSAFPAFAGVREQLQDFIFANFVPQVGDVVLTHLEDFARKTGSLTAVGVIFLVVTSVMLLTAISGAFDAVWRVRARRPLVARLLVYWAVLTLTPLLLGASLSLSGYLFAIARDTGVEQYTGPLTRLAGLVPPLLQIAVFSLLFLLVPFFPVRRRDALLGGITAGLLLELLKKGFGLYITNFPTYQTIYGALATFPIFLLWMYVVWTVVLYGAEITASLPEWKAGLRNARAGPRSPTQVLTAAVAVLAALLAASRKGERLGRRRLMRVVRHDPESMFTVTELLSQRNYISKAQDGAYMMARDLDSVTLADLYGDLGLAISTAAPAAAKSAWAKRFADTVARADSAGRDRMAVSLKTLLATPDEEIDAVIGNDGDEPDDSPADRKTGLLALLGLAWLATR